VTQKLKTDAGEIKVNLGGIGSAFYFFISFTYDWITHSPFSSFMSSYTPRR